MEAKNRPGNEPSSLEHRILNIMLIYGIIACFVSSVINFALGLGDILVWVTLLGSIILSILYYLSTAKKQYAFPLLFGAFIFTFFIIPLTWIFNAGTMGGIPYYIIVFSSVLATLMKGLRRFAFVSILVIITAALVVIEYKFPSLIKGYDNDLARLADISAGLIITVVSNALLFVTVLNSYNKEHKNVREYLTQLEITNEQLQKEIAERAQAEKALQESEDKYRTIFQTTGTAIIIAEEDATISLANEEFEKLSGYTRAELEGKIGWKQFLSAPSPERLFETRLLSVAGSYLKDQECRFIDRYGKAKEVLINLSLIPGTKKSVVSFVDISAIKQAEAKLKYLATHDYLTGIPNRYYFEESLQKAVAKARRGKKSAFLFIDLDNFKAINDTKGHAAGDELLINVANTIKKHIRESDFLARLGGDEFGVLLEEVTADQAMLVAEKLRRLTEESASPSFGNLSLSIGVVMIDGTLDSQKLFALADSALYAAKEKGRNRAILLAPTVKNNSPTSGAGQDRT